MLNFFSSNNHRKGNTPGGAFTGKELRRMLSPDSLEELALILDVEGAPWISYLKSISAVYSACVQKELVPDFSYEKAFHDFRVCFNTVHNLSEGRITETLKALFDYFLSYLLSIFFHFSKQFP